MGGLLHMQMYVNKISMRFNNACSVQKNYITLISMQQLQMDPKINKHVTLLWGKAQSLLGDLTNVLQRHFKMWINNDKIDFQTEYETIL